VTDDRTLSPERAALAALLAGFGAWYLLNLEGALYVDEVFYARTGYGLLTGDPYRNPTHAAAPTAKLFVGLGQTVLGQTSVGVRLPVALFGVLALAVTYRVGALVAGPITGLFAAALLGSTHLFASHAVMGMLDVPLTASVAGTVLFALRWLRTSRRRDALLLGAVAAAAATTKVYGVVYAAPVVAVALWLAARRGTDGGIRTAARPVVAGGAATVALVYLPFVVVPHPPVPAEFVPAALAGPVRALLSVPVLGNFVYLFGATFVQNVLHVSKGHAVVVAGTVYQSPPLWTYVYWIVDAGPVYAYAALLPLALLRTRLWRRGDATALVLGAATAVPLVGMSLLSVKMPRYALPLFPLIAVGGVAPAIRLGRTAVERFAGGRRLRRSGVLRALVVVAVLAGGLAPVTSSVAAAGSDGIRADSGFDRVTDHIEESAAARPDRELLVLTYHNKTFTYYYDGPDNVRNVGLGTAQLRRNDDRRERLESLIERGEIDFVVDLRHNPRLAGTRLARLVRERGDPILTVTQYPERRTIVVYAMENDTTDRTERRGGSTALDRQRGERRTLADDRDRRRAHPPPSVVASGRVDPAWPARGARS